MNTYVYISICIGIYPDESGPEMQKCLNSMASTLDAKVQFNYVYMYINTHIYGHILVNTFM
jgi:hypothetical protein